MSTDHRLFVDTSALIALLNDRDQFHDAVKRFLEGCPNNLETITSNLVLAELLTFFSRHGSIQEILRFEERLLGYRPFKIVWVDLSLHQTACGILKKFADQRLSFTDATSFAIMKKERLTHALTFDDDFVRAGFETVPS